MIPKLRQVQRGKLTVIPDCRIGTVLEEEAREVHMTLLPTPNATGSAHLRRGLSRPHRARRGIALVPHIT
jgi:hypothetical protein